MFIVLYSGFTSDYVRETISDLQSIRSNWYKIISIFMALEGPKRPLVIGITKNYRNDVTKN
jgi:hypothetical protein